MVSTTKLVVLLSTKMLLRSRLSLVFDEVHTSQPQATMGTPVLVPVPKKVILIGGQCMEAKVRNWQFARQ